MTTTKLAALLLNSTNRRSSTGLRLLGYGLLICISTLSLHRSIDRSLSANNSSSSSDHQDAVNAPPPTSSLVKKDDIILQQPLEASTTTTAAPKFLRQSAIPADAASNNSIGQQQQQQQKVVVAEAGSKLKIGIISGFVTKPGLPMDKRPRIHPNLMDHMLNKACYADLHGYDYIFNTTWGFENSGSGKPLPSWLNYGTWHRVPHMQAALPNYDWIVYADTDWIVQDLSLPLEALLKELELYNKLNASVFVPVDSNDRYTFSAFVVMIRNNPFGRRLLENWNQFALGNVCPAGNFRETIPGKYNWGDSDQPGLWWALVKTHSEFTNTPLDGIFECTDDGYIKTNRYFGPETAFYFKNRTNYMFGCEGIDLDVRREKFTNRAVKDDQYIIWTRLGEETRSGMGYQATFGRFKDGDWKHAFALHSKDPFNERMKRHVQYCQRARGCYAFYSSNKTTDTNNKKQQVKAAAAAARDLRTDDLVKVHLHKRVEADEGAQEGLFHLGCNRDFLPKP